MRLVKYSNAAYSMLGLVIEAASGRPYDEFILECILKPLGMRDTAFQPAPDQEPRLVQGYYLPPYERRWAPSIHHELKAFTPCGMLASTVDDVLRLPLMYWGGPSILSEDSRREMLRTHLMDPESPDWRMGYALGWRQTRLGDRVYSGHGGSYPGFICNVQMSPRHRVAVALFANHSRARATGDMALRWLDRLVEVAPPVVETLDDAPPPPAWRALLGTYASHRRFEMRIEFRRGGLRLVGGHYPEPGVALAEDSADRFRILSSRGAGEHVVVTRRDEAGRAMEITVCGERATRI